jgi:glycosyltransferase involved in cell wall biosynthesis
MKVLLVVKGLDLGGIERMVVQLASGLRERDVDAEVAVFNGQRRQLFGELEAAGVPVHVVGASDRLSPKSVLALRSVIKRHGPFDVVHAHGPLPAVVARLAVRRSAVVLSTSHTLWSGLHPLTRAAWRSTVRFDHQPLAVSAAVAESLPRSRGGRARVIPHGIDLPQIERIIADRGPRSDGVVRAICVASHRDVKNYPNLLEAVRQAHEAVPSLRLLAVGDGPSRPYHEQLAGELGLAEVVEFRAATTEVLSLMAASDVLVVASDFEGQPIVVSEAMALGVPVVATAVGRVPELVSPASGRVVPPRDPAALAAALVQVASDEELRARLGAAASAAASSWSLDDVVDAHLELYQRLVTVRAAMTRRGGDSTAGGQRPER